MKDDYYKNSYGFVYMWCDLKRNKFYIGSHNGNSISTRYKTGNSRMRNVINNRPDTCKKVILEYCYIDDRMELYNLENKWLSFYDVSNSPHFYNKKGCAVGGIPDKTENRSSPKKGIKMKDIRPDWVNPSKGKRLREVYGENIKTNPPIPAKPFMLIIYEPDKAPYNLIFHSISECCDKIKLSNSAILYMSLVDEYKLKRVMKNTKHSFPKNTIFKHHFIDENGKIIEHYNSEERSIRLDLFKKNIDKKLLKQKNRGGKNPVGKKPKPFDIIVYEPCRQSYRLSFRTNEEFIKKMGVNNVWIGQLKTEKIKAVISNRGQTKHMFPLGTVVVLETQCDMNTNNKKPKNSLFKPFMLNISHPNSPKENILCYNIDDFCEKTKLPSDVIRFMKRDGKYVIKLKMSTNKHNYDIGTVFDHIPLTEYDLVKIYNSNM